MSTNLYMRPVPREQPPAEELPFGLKKAISQRLWGHDGSLYGDEVEVGPSMVPYLEGLADGGSGEISAGATELLAAIRTHGAVTLWIGE